MNLKNHLFLVCSLHSQNYFTEMIYMPNSVIQKSNVHLAYMDCLCTNKTFLNLVQTRYFIEIILLIHYSDQKTYGMEDQQQHPQAIWHTYLVQARYFNEVILLIQYSDKKQMGWMISSRILSPLGSKLFLLSITMSPSSSCYLSEALTIYTLSW